MKIIRTFHPIGQGAFYSESFHYNKKKINIIYDCGSLTSIDKIKNEIELSFPENTVIDAVFISHFDTDHVNAIPFLINRCNVKNIFFPLISEEDKILLKIKAILEETVNVFAINFLEKPKHTIVNLINLKDNNIPRLIAVQAINDETQENNEQYDHVIPSGMDVSDIISSDLKNLKWEFIPHNFKQKERIKEFRELKQYKDLLKEVPDYSLENLSSYLQNRKDSKDKILEIREAYKKISGNLNSNSMTLFSGAISENLPNHSVVNSRITSTNIRANNNVCSSPFEDFRLKNHRLKNRRLKNLHLKNLYKSKLNYYHSQFYYFSFKRNSGCLYTGDYDASKEDHFWSLKEKYNKYWEYIQYFQVPHHGSKNNFNEKFVDFNKIYIVSAGSKNQYKHPHNEVLREILIKNAHLFIVTEVSKSVVSCLIEF